MYNISIHYPDLIKETVSRLVYFSESENIDTKQLVSNTRQNQRTIETILKNYGVDTNELKSLAKDISNKLSNAIKSGSTKRVELITQTSSLKIKNYLKKMKLNITDERVLKSILLLVIVFLLSWLFDFTLTAVLSSIGIGFLAPVIMSLLIAPFFEEVPKAMAIFGNYEWTYTTLFAGTEYLLKLVTLWKGLKKIAVSKGARFNSKSLLSYALISLPAIALHFITTKIQKVISKDVDSNLSDKSKRNLGYIIAVIVHSFFNLFTSLLTYLSMKG